MALPKKRMNVTLQFTTRCARNAWSRESSVKSCLGSRGRQRSRQRALYTTSCVFCVSTERHCCCPLLTLISCLAKTVCDCVSGPLNCCSILSPPVRLATDKRAITRASEPWTQRIWWERTLSHKMGVPKATKVAPAALGHCINSHQSDLNSFIRLQEKRQVQPSRSTGKNNRAAWDMKETTLFPSCSCLGFFEHEAKGLLQTGSTEILEKTCVIHFVATARARHIRIWMVASLLRFSRAAPQRNASRVGLSSVCVIVCVRVRTVV